MLTLESAELSAELQQDLGVLGMQAVPHELRTWVTGVDLPLMPVVPPFLVDICFCVSGYKFYCHKVADSTIKIDMGRIVLCNSLFSLTNYTVIGNICSYVYVAGRNVPFCLYKSALIKLIAPWILH
jgi:hypothetical protein